MRHKTADFDRDRYAVATPIQEVGGARNLQRVFFNDCTRSEGHSYCSLEVMRD